MLPAALRKPFKQNRLMHALAVPHWARYDAKQDTPVPTNNTWAPIETRIGDRFDHDVTEILATRERKLKSERVAAIDNELREDERVFPALVDETKARIYAARLKFNTRWSQVRERARERYQDLQDFKHEHMLKREATYHPIILAFGVCAIAFVGETAVNAALFAEVSRWGLAGGAMNAMTLSLPNIVLGLAAGFWGMRARQHIRPLIHHTGTIVTVITLSSALAWNLYVGHFRLFAERLSHTRQELRLSDWQGVRAQIVNDPLAPFASSQAVALMFVGLIVVAIALADGLDGFSDRYPGFARVDRRYRRALKDVAAIKASMLRTFKRLTRRGIRSVLKHQRAAAAKIREALRILNGARGTIVKYESRIDESFWVHREVLCEYQQLNARHRDQVPDRFATVQFPGSRAARPVYDWQAARAEIQSRAEQANAAARNATAELHKHRLAIISAIEAESAQVTRAPVLLPPPRITFAQATV
jgi:hypothetical protein